MGFHQELLAISELNLGHIKPCLPQPWAGFLLLKSYNSRNKESRCHSASTFPESLKSQGTLEVTDDETGPKVSPWVHTQALRRMKVCPLCKVLVRPDWRGLRILVSTF